MFFYRDLNFLDAGVNVQDCVVARADDGLVFNDDNLKRKRREKKKALKHAHTKINERTRDTDFT